VSGKTNNPNGRPKGVTNKLTGLHRSQLSDILAGKFKKFDTELGRLEGGQFVKAYIELLRFVVPHAKPEEPAAAEEYSIDFLKLTAKNQ
jgi:hypothetical protein